MFLALYERNATMYAAWKRRGADKCLRWLPSENGLVPDGAVKVGFYGGRGGEPMYVGRVTLPTNETVPGTIIPSRNACYAAWKGRELEAADYEVLVNTNPEICYLHWSALTPDGCLPQGSVKGGFDPSNDSLIYIVRSRPPGGFGTHAGQIRDGDQEATLSMDGYAHQVTDFKVLCRQFLHAYTNNYRPYTC